MRIQAQGLTKVFKPRRGAPVKALDGITLDVADGEFVVVLGPSGSGKTTLLRCVAGLERADAGEVRIGDEIVFASEPRRWVPPERRGISMVFQSYALWPHMTVFENVAYPLRGTASRADIEDRVRRTLKLVGCGDLVDRYPSQLSGGQQQRVAVARAVIRGTGLVLFDEPLSSVDARVREELRRELSALQRELRFTSIYITHDQVEACMLGDRVAVLSAGRILQVASPRELYASPVSSDVAEFLGAANRLAGSVERVDGKGCLISTPVGAVLSTAEPARRCRPGDRVTVVIRPEDCRLNGAGRTGANHWDGRVETAAFLGFCTEYVVRVGESAIAVRSVEHAPLASGDRASLTVAPEAVYAIPAGSA